MALEKIIASIGLLACLAVWLWLALDPQQRAAWRVWPARQWRRLRVGRQAKRDAASVIDRARRKPAVDRDGNVYRPKSFDRPDEDPGSNDRGGRDRHDKDHPG